MKVLATTLSLLSFTALAASPALSHDDRLHEIEHLFEHADVVTGPELVDCTLSGGTETTCFKITVRVLPKEREPGPWCPTNIADGPDKGGIWLDGGEVHDVDGAFIEGLAEFYDDGEWAMYDPETGAINYTETAEECALAARPDVDPALQNHCVQCLPEYLEADHTMTYTIPLEPVMTDAAPDTRIGGSGVALDGVKLEGHAPVDAILSAHTLAPFDDCGGHINPFEGYHYHAATDCQETAGAEATAEMALPAPLIGIAMDGNYVLAWDDTLTDLDECRGHTVNGVYYYHAGPAGGNSIIACHVAEIGCSSEDPDAVCDASQRRGPPPQ